MTKNQRAAGAPMMNVGGITTIYGVGAVALFLYFKNATSNIHRNVQGILTGILVIAIVVSNVWPAVHSGVSHASVSTDQSANTPHASQPKTDGAGDRNSPKSSQQSPAPPKASKNRRVATSAKDKGSTQSSESSASGNENSQHSSQQMCPNGICIGGDNYGSPTVINKGVPPVSINSAQADEITRAMASYEQRHIEILTSGITDETVSAGLQLKSSLEKAGLVVDFQKIMMLFVSGGTKPPPGISFGATSDQDDLANTLGLALIQSGVIGHPVRVYRLPGTGRFSIYVGASTP